MIEPTEKKDYFGKYYCLPRKHNRQHISYHNLRGPASIGINMHKDWRGYYIDGIFYDNFIEYIKDVIKYKKDNA